MHSARWHTLCYAVPAHPYTQWPTHTLHPLEMLCAVKEGVLYMCIYFYIYTPPPHCRNGNFWHTRRMCGSSRVEVGQSTHAHTHSVSIASFALIDARSARLRRGRHDQCDFATVSISIARSKALSRTGSPGLWLGSFIAVCFCGASCVLSPLYTQSQTALYFQVVRASAVPTKPHLV